MMATTLKWYIFGLALCLFGLLSGAQGEESDMEVTKAQLTSPPIQGVETWAMVSLKNLREGVSGYADIKVYVSDDAVWDESDDLVGQDSIWPISVIEQHETVYLVINHPPGNYYLIFEAFARDGQEVDESNNRVAVEFTLEARKIDFLVSTFKTKSSVFSKGKTSEFESYFSTENSYAPGDRMDAQYFLSKDTILDDGDYLLMTETEVLEEYDLVLYWKNKRQMIEFPADFQGEEAYVLVKGTYTLAGGGQNGQFESNVKWLKIRFSEPAANPFLTQIESGDHASWAYDYNIWVQLPNEDLVRFVKMTIGNNGNIPVENLKLKLYQSYDTFFDDSDQLIYTDEVSLLENSIQYYHLNNEFDVDALDDRYPFIVAVLEGGEEDVNKNDNVAYIEFVKSDPAYDLYITHVKVENSEYYPLFDIYPIGEKSIINARQSDILEMTFEAEVDVDSIFDESTSFDIGFYFSEDNLFSTKEDAELTYVSDTRELEMDLKIPLRNATARDGYLVVQIDPHDKLPEYTRRNNSIAFPISVSHMAGIKVFPNPVEDLLHFSSEVQDFEVYDAFGRKVMEGSGTDQFSVADLSVGMYVINVEGIQQIKFIKKQ